MARKIKRMSRKELRQPDEVMTGLQLAYEWLRKYRVYIAVGAAGLLVVLLGASGLSSWISGRARDKAADFDTAYAVLYAEVGPEAPVIVPPPAGDEKKDKKERFETAEAKAKAAVERLQAYLGENEGSDLGDLATLGLASAFYAQKKWDDAGARLKAYLDDSGDSPLKAQVIENLGLVAMNNGKIEDAKKQFEELAKIGGAYRQAVAEAYLGDLFNPTFGGPRPGTSADEAKKHYEAALAALTRGERPVLPGERPLQESVERKLAFLAPAS